MSVIHLLQIAYPLAWAIPFAMLAPAVWRSLRGRADALDLIRLPHFFTTLVMLMFGARWLIFPGAVAAMDMNELIFWAACYLLGIGAALGHAAGIRLANRQVRR